MTRISQIIEVTPTGIRPDLAERGPAINARVLREGMFKWFYLADIPHRDPMRARKVLIGPFLTRRQAKRAWEMVIQIHKEWMDQQKKLLEAMGLEKEFEAFVKQGEQTFAEDIFPDLPPNN